jgi:beta-alanine degradation protein BauB
VSAEPSAPGARTPRGRLDAAPGRPDHARLRADAPEHLHPLKEICMPDPAHADRPLAVATVQYETERVLVTEWRFAPGSHTGWHRHAYDYVVVPLTTGQLLIDGPDGQLSNPLVAGRSYGRGAGVEHDVINDNPTEFVFIEIELK